MRNGTLIVGASQAGIQFATSLRSSGYAEPITVIDGAANEPYQRPPLSKDFLEGTVNLQDLRFRDREFYESNGIQVELGSPVEHIERTGDGGVAVTEGGERFPFDQLVLAVGAAPRRLVLPGADQGGVHYLRDAADASALKEALDAAGNVVVVGGGFIGLEVAASALKQGKTVTVLEAAPRIIGRAVGEETSEWVQRAHEKHGMRIETGVELQRFHSENGHVAAVELRDGTVIPADVVLVGIGVVPRTELAEQLGLEINNGIVVDEYSVASDGKTIAIGDVACIPNPYAPTEEAAPRIRLESVNNAIDQAQAATGTILGNPVSYKVIPWFWSNQGDVRIQMAGLNMGYDDVLIRGEQSGGKAVILYYRGETLLAADCLNSPADFMAIRQGLRKGKHLSKEKALQEQPFKELFSDAVTVQ